jgi:hypothetical protein
VTFDAEILLTVSGGTSRPALVQDTIEMVHLCSRRAAFIKEPLVVQPSVAGIGLSDAIQVLRAELMAAAAAGADEPLQFPIAKMTVELQVVATKAADGKAGFRVPVVAVEMGGASHWQRENTQTVTIEFGPPVDHDGRPVKVASASSQLKD